VTSTRYARACHTPSPPRTAVAGQQTSRFSLTDAPRGCDRRVVAQTSIGGQGLVLAAAGPCGPVGLERHISLTGHVRTSYYVHTWVCTIVSKVSPWSIHSPYYGSLCDVDSCPSTAQVSRPSDHDADHDAETGLGHVHYVTLGQPKQCIVEGDTLKAVETETVQRKPEYYPRWGLNIEKQAARPSRQKVQELTATYRLVKIDGKHVLRRVEAILRSRCATVPHSGHE